MQRRTLLIGLAVILTLAVLGAAVVLVLDPFGTGGAQATPAAPGGAQATPEPIPLVQVIVALQPIARGAPFVSGSIGPRDWPASSPLPPDSIGDEIETVGKVARTDIVQGQIIVRSMLADPGQAGEASLQIPPGRVAVAYPINRQSSVAFAIQPGDTVDILVTAFFVDVDEEFQTILPNKAQFIIPNQEFNEEIGTIVSGVELLDPLDQGRTDIYGEGEQAITAVVYGRGQQIPRRVAQLTVQAAKVIGIGSWLPEPPPKAPQEGQEPPTPTPNIPNIVTLAVTPQDALVLLWLRQSGISTEMALRAANEENADHLTEAVTLQYMLTRFSIAVPPKIDIIMGEPTSVEKVLQEIEALGLEPQDLEDATEFLEKLQSDGGTGPQ